MAGRARVETADPTRGVRAGVITKTIKRFKRLVVAAVGFTVLAIGIAMMVLPGPATLVIPAGLAILATEFVWARRVLRRLEDQWRKQKERLIQKRKESQDGMEAQ
jgi:uncharacterized protein (TIGR02611 family)